MSRTTDGADKLYKEFVSHMQEDDIKAPYVSGHYLYYEREAKGCDYPVHCRKPRLGLASSEPGHESCDEAVVVSTRSCADSARRRRLEVYGEEEVVLDCNALAKGHLFFQLGAFQPSPDHTLLAYSIDTSGREAFDLRIIVSAYVVLRLTLRARRHAAVAPAVGPPIRLLQRELGSP